MTDLTRLTNWLIQPDRLNQLTQPDWLTRLYASCGSVCEGVCVSARGVGWVSECEWVWAWEYECTWVCVYASVSVRVCVSMSVGVTNTLALIHTRTHVTHALMHSCVRARMCVRGCGVSVRVCVCECVGECDCAWHTLRHDSLAVTHMSACASVSNTLIHMCVRVCECQTLTRVGEYEWVVSKCECVSDTHTNTRSHTQTCDCDCGWV